MVWRVPKDFSNCEKCTVSSEVSISSMELREAPLNPVQADQTTQGRSYFPRNNLMTWRKGSNKAAWGQKETILVLHGEAVARNYSRNSILRRKVNF
jgi:hypothetical protein